MNQPIIQQGETEKKNNIDFVVPLHKYNTLFRATIEGIIYMYKPSNIYIITSNNYKLPLQESIVSWDTQKTMIIFLDEETFFIPNYNLKIDEIKKWYKYLDNQSREFGWWYQQIIKLGAFKQIPNLSDPYIVWDSDLIPLIKWELGNHIFAILQDKAKSEFNKEQYNLSIKDLLGVDAIEPEVGTFVPHHYVFYHRILNHLFKYIEQSKNSSSWIEHIMSLSHKYYRFSEYKLVSTFINKYYKPLLHYHKFDTYGKNGRRYRNNKEILSLIHNSCNIQAKGISYIELKSFIEKNLGKLSYMQIEHIV